MLKLNSFLEKFRKVTNIILFWLLLILIFYFINSKLIKFDFFILYKEFFYVFFIFLLFLYFFKEIVKYIKSMFRLNEKIFIFTNFSLIFIFECIVLYIYSSEKISIIIFLILLLFFIYKILITYLIFELNFKNDNLKNNEGLLISDKSIDWIELKDELWFQDNADNFAKIVYNNWSSDNQIFWLVAERWAWKTSFLNLFKNNPTILKDSIYIEFNPWYYETEKDLLEKFLENIISNLKAKNYFLPKLHSNFKSFLKLLDDNSENLFWLKLWFSNIKTLIDIKDDINESLKTVSKKIIIVIDDLDRIQSNKLKEIFRIVDLCKDFYNTSYILCYDPLNFNSIDNNLVQTYSQEKSFNPDNKRFEENLNIHTQKVDNSELVRYMSKIINVYYPLIIDKEELKNYFVNLFTKNKNIQFSDESIKWINKWIDSLLEIKNYRIWWKYYSNVRAIKRILNNLIVTSYKSNQSNYISNLFNKNSWGLDFDIMVKFSILKLYFNHLFKDIETECLYWSLYNKYNLWLTNKENENYISYLNILNIYEKEIILNLLPLYETNLLFSDKKKIEEIRDYWIINKYIDIENTSEKSEYNSFIIGKIYKYIETTNNIQTLKIIFKEINEKYKNEWCNDFVVKFIYSIKDFDKSIIKDKWSDFLNFILKYKDFYNYTPNFQFEFSSDIVKVLSSFLNKLDNSKNVVRNFIYWINNKKSFVDTIIDFTKNDLKYEWLLQVLDFIRVFNKDNGGYYNQFMELLQTDDLKTAEDLRWEYCVFLFEKLKENNYFDDVNIFTEMLDFEIKNNTNQLTYWLQNLLESLSEANKKEFVWYLKQGFEYNINFFLNYFFRYLSSNFSRSFRDLKLDAEKINFDDFYNVFDKEYLKTLLNKKDKVNNNLKIDFNNNYSEKLIYPSSMTELFELFEKTIK